MKEKKTSKPADNAIELTTGEMQAVLEAQEEIIKAQVAEIERLRTQAAGKNVKPLADLPSGTFRMNGNEYRFRLPAFILPGRGKMTAHEAIKDSALCAELVELESGVIEMINV